MSAKNWCFTLNNYTQDEYTHLKESDLCDVRYLIFGKERGSATETDHLQGFVSFTKRLRLSSVKRFIGVRAHCEIARGSIKQNRGK